MSDNTKKNISVLLLIVLFTNDFVPCARAIASIETHSTKKVENAFLFARASAVRNASVEKSRAVQHRKASKQTASLTRLLAPAPLPLPTGPSQAESSGFSLGSTDGMVDKFTGDFSYSLPIMDVEGYPLVLNYNSNVGMQSEASWVGLGWDMNVGAISREMNGVPDEFNGKDEIVRTYKQKNEEITDGKKNGGYVSLSTAFTILEKKKFNLAFAPKIQYTNLNGSYNSALLGIGYTIDHGLQASFNIYEKAGNTLDQGGWGGGFTFSYGYSSDSKRGIGYNYSFGLDGGYNNVAAKNGYEGGLTYGKSLHSRVGLVEQSFGINLSYTRNSLDKNKNLTSKGIFGTGGSSSLSYGTPTSIPKIAFNTIIKSFSNSLTLSIGISSGLTVKSGYKHMNYHSTSSIPSDDYKLYQPAYGYLHSSMREKYTSLDNYHYPVMDFTRSSDMGYSENMTNLPFSVQSYDVFNVNALGIGGVFRAGRTDYGTYYDATNRVLVNLNQGGNGVDVVDESVGFTVYPPASVSIDASVAVGFQSNETTSQLWNDGDANKSLRFSSVSDNYPPSFFDPTTYFKAVGENTPTEMTAWNVTQGNTPINYDVNTTGDNKISLETTLRNPSSIQLLSSSLNSYNKRPVRATSFMPHTVEELTTETVDSRFYSEVYNYSSLLQVHLPSAFSRNGGIRKSNHISAIEVTSTDGTHYTYGMPAYNITQTEVLFSAGNVDQAGGAPALTAGSDGLAAYSATDNSVVNNRGRSAIYDKTTMPSYPHSFLLTNMTGSDYVDRAGDGPTVDDIGSYYKFNYTQKYSTTNPYTWRFPISGGTTSAQPKAFLNRGFLASDLDDMCSYMYGEKEIWYTQSIESKNQIAVIYLKEREDAYGVTDEAGKITLTKPLMYIDKICLYNLSDYKKRINGRLEGSSDPVVLPTPLQTVEFEYDYSLCLKNPANKNTYNGNTPQSGKLTLKKVRVYAGASKELGLSSYSFEYSSANPNFSYVSTDSWGGYKPNGTLGNDIFPYPDQSNSVTSDSYANNWKMVAINNPMGGRTAIQYEADRYGYVQTERAMRHIPVTGMTSVAQLTSLQNQSTWDGITGSTDQFRTSGTPNNVMIFKLVNPISPTQATTKSVANQLLKQNYFTGSSSNQSKVLSTFLFKLMVRITSNSSKQEFIPYMASIADAPSSAVGNIGVMPLGVSGNYEYGYVVIKLTNTDQAYTYSNKTDDNNSAIELNPLQKNALDFARQSLPEIVYGACAACQADLSIDEQALYGKGVYHAMIEDKKYVPSINTRTSFIRLYEPDTVKFGGNARVKKITYYDNWKDISGVKNDLGENNLGSGEYNSSYSWLYSYDNREAAVGVASFEPSSMLDECKLYEWKTYINSAERFPNEQLFTPTPVAAAFYPQPVVGYQEVKVEFSDAQTQGHSLTTFYTNKQEAYKTLAQETNIEVSKKMSIPWLAMFILTSYIRLGFTQGYLVQTNDFHGKLKQTAIYNNQALIQARTTYNYYGLGEAVPVLDRTGELKAREIATEYDIHADSRAVTDHASFSMFGVGASIRFYPVSPPVPTFYPIFSLNFTKKEYFSNAIIKHINRSAVVKSIESEYMGSINTAENMVYDHNTGAVLVSSLKDEFEDKLYSVNYPSHWYNKSFRDIASAGEALPQGTLDANGLFTISNPSIALDEQFVPGDRVRLISIMSSPSIYGTVLSVQPTQIKFIVLTGSTTGNVLLSLVRSNRSNRLGEMMQSVVTKKPISMALGSFTFPTTEIISSSAINYRERQQLHCSATANTVGYPVIGLSINPFTYGVKGDFVLNDQFAWQAERINATHPHGIRFDGTYSTFAPFYALNTSTKKWYGINETSHPNYSAAAPYQNWRKTGTVTLFDEYGKPIESKDPLGVYSSVLYGYNKTYGLLPVAQAVNAQQQQIAYDGFEDYDYITTSSPNETTHFDFRKTLNGTTVLLSDPTAGSATNQRHSGKRSLLIKPTGSASVVSNLATTCTPPTTSPTISSNYIVESCACIPPFAPTPGDYLISVWVNSEKVGTNSVSIKLDNTNTSLLSLTPLSSTITVDGWTRLEGKFTIPATGASKIEVVIKNGSTTNMFIDDLRIHPFLAAMSSVVYDPNTLLPMATHDGYNFTTFYNYDENLQQARLRVETQQGITTVTESEVGGKKDFKQ